VAEAPHQPQPVRREARAVRADQRGRLVRVTDPAFTGGGMPGSSRSTTRCYSDYEESHGHVAVLVTDVDFGLCGAVVSPVPGTPAQRRRRPTGSVSGSVRRRSRARRGRRRWRRSLIWLRSADGQRDLDMELADPRRRRPLDQLAAHGPHAVDELLPVGQVTGPPAEKAEGQLGVRSHHR
jgi:hypothetical protein